MGIQRRERTKSGVSYLVSWKDAAGRRKTATVRGSLAEAQELEARKQELERRKQDVLLGSEQQKSCFPTFGAYAFDLLDGRDHGLPRPICSSVDSGPGAGRVSD